MKIPNHFLLIVILISASASLHAQHLAPRDKKIFALREDTLKLESDSMINADEASDRFRADSNFVRGLVRALKIKNSFWYPFDSLLTVSHLYAPDSTFRIFTWGLKKDAYVYLQKGAIQVRTDDGSLKLFPLFDYSMFTGKATDSVRTPDKWIGSIYYKIVLKENKGIKYYTLLGFDEFSLASSKKWADVLHFDKNGEPLFGGNMFSFKNDSIARPVQARFNIEYKKEATALMNYDPDVDMIVFDHLISESNEPEKKDSYVADGTYEGFKWVNGQWLHVYTVFDYKLQDGQFPTEEKIRDDKGNIDEQKLMESSRKNMERGKRKND